MRKGEKFSASDEEGISCESDDPANFMRHLIEVNAKYGDDAQVVFNQLGLALGRRAGEKVKKLKPLAQGGRPVKREPIDGDKVKELRGTTHQKLVVRMCKKKICLATLQRAEAGEATKATRDTLAKYFKVDPETLKIK